MGGIFAATLGREVSLIMGGRFAALMHGAATLAPGVSQQEKRARRMMTCDVLSLFYPASQYILTFLFGYHLFIIVI